VPVRPRILHGRPTDVLLLAARSADMLIVGSRGHGSVAGILLDSVNQHCVQRAPCPVLVIPAAPVTSPLDLFSPRRRGRRAIPTCSPPERPATEKAATSTTDGAGHDAGDRTSRATAERCPLHEVVAGTRAEPAPDAVPSRLPVLAIRLGFPTPRRASH
jgi:hypothetical protein